MLPMPQKAYWEGAYSLRGEGIKADWGNACGRQERNGGEKQGASHWESGGIF